MRAARSAQLRGIAINLSSISSHGAQQKSHAQFAKCTFYKMMFIVFFGLILNTFFCFSEPLLATHTLFIFEFFSQKISGFRAGFVSSSSPSSSSSRLLLQPQQHPATIFYRPSHHQFCCCQLWSVYSPPLSLA